MPANPTNPKRIKTYASVKITVVLLNRKAYLTRTKSLVEGVKQMKNSLRESDSVIELDVYIAQLNRHLSDAEWEDDRITTNSLQQQMKLCTLLKEFGESHYTEF